MLGSNAVKGTAKKSLLRKKKKKVPFLFILRDSSSQGPPGEAIYSFISGFKKIHKEMIAVN